MRIWIIKTGEPLPTDSAKVRLLRAGILAQDLAERGHEVVWWSSSFNHQLKKQRNGRGDRPVELASNYRLWTIPSPGYKKNVSAARLWDHHLTAKRFSRLATKESRPDIILSALPTLELGAAAARYAREQRVPLIVDVRDLWPDVFVRAVPKPLRLPAELLLSRYRRMARSVCRSAAAITGHAPAFVQWGLDMADRQATAYDRDFPFGYRPVELSADMEQQGIAFWKRLGIDADNGEKVVAFVGSLGKQFDFGPVLHAARSADPSLKMRVVICGAGEALPELREAAAGCDRLVFPGWIDAPEIQTLLGMSSLALAPYIRTNDFQQSIPNKFVEYLAAGLPLATTLGDGVVGQLLRRGDCGASYETGPELAGILEAVLTDPQKQQRWAKNARRLYQQEFSTDSVCEEMADYLTKIAGTSRARAPLRLAA